MGRPDEVGLSDLFASMFCCGTIMEQYLKISPLHSRKIVYFFILKNFSQVFIFEITEKNYFTIIGKKKN